MPASNIEINGTATSKDQLAINTTVQLSNADIGGESTYLWEIVDQPEGTVDSLSASNIENPTFTPKKEGTYLIRLTVNAGTSPLVNTKVACVRHLKTNERVPAASESLELDSTFGWKTAVNRVLARVQNVLADANLLVCVNSSGSPAALGDIVRFSAVSIIKSGLPGQERLLTCQPALATADTNIRGGLGVVVGTPTGAAPSAGNLCIVRRYGLVEITESGSPAVGAGVFVDNTGQPATSSTGITYGRRVGHVVESSGGTWRWFADGSRWEAPSVLGLAAVGHSFGTNWAPNAAGYMLSSGAGTLYLGIPLRRGERPRSISFDHFGDGVADLTSVNYRLVDVNGVITTLGTTSATNQPASWTTYSFNLTQTPVGVTGNESAYIEFVGNAANLRISQVNVFLDTVDPT